MKEKDKLTLGALLWVIIPLLIFSVPFAYAAVAIDADNNGYGGTIRMRDDYENYDIGEEVFETIQQRQSERLLGVDRLSPSERLWICRSYTEWEAEEIFSTPHLMDGLSWGNSRWHDSLPFMRQQNLCESQSSFSRNLSGQQQRYEEQSAVSDGRETLGIEIDNHKSEGNAQTLFQGRYFNGEISEGIWGSIRNGAGSDTRNNLEDCWIESAWPKCDDSNKFNGYWFRDEGFVPGMITVETHFTPAPQFISGAAVYYAPGLMEATARYRGLDLSGFVDGVAMMSCADIGQEVWIWEGRSWEGPFLVVDCAEWDDMWPVTVHRNEVVEVGWKTAIRWGMIERNEYTKPVYVWKSKSSPRRINREVILVSYKNWFLENVEYLPAGMIGLPQRPIFFPPHKWWINGEWIDFVERTRFDNNVSRYYIGVRNMVLGP